MRERSVRAIGLLGAGMALGLLPGCHRPDTLVGSWSGTGGLGNGQSYPTRAEFRPDGKVVLDTDSPLGKVVSTANYTFSDGLLQETPTRVTLNGTPLTIPLSAQTFRVTLAGDSLTLDRQDKPTKFVLTRVH